MEKKYFFFDIDGTLTDRSTGEIVPSAREALKRLEANEHFVAIATGSADSQKPMGLKIWFVVEEMVV